MPTEEQRERQRQYLKRYYQANKEKYRERHQRWREKHPERVKELRAAAYARRKANGTYRKHHLASRYGITPEDEQALWEKQGGLCAICDQVLVAQDYRRVHLDHDHKTGRVRGILCLLCNQGLGRFRDSPELLHRAVQYLAES